MATQVSDAGSKSRVRGGSADELAVIAQRAQAFTNASGTAIALSEGNMDEIVCRARAGSSAPEVGTSLRVEGTFTGLCIQTGKELRCDDAETDTRVDTGAIRALGIRSMVVIPIKEEGRVTGVLAVFAPTAHAFTITHVAVLKTMADQISALLQRQRKGPEEASVPEPIRAAPEPVRAAPAPVARPAMPPTPPVVVKPATPAPAAAPRAHFPVVSKVEPVKASVTAEEVVPLPKRKKADKREEQESRSDSRPGFNTLDAAATPANRPANNILFLGGAAVAILVAVGVFSVYKFSKSPAPAAQHTQEASNTGSSTVAPGNSQPSPSSAPTSAPAAPMTTTGTVNTANNSAPPKRPETSAPRNVSPAPAQPRHDEPQAKREEPQQPQPKREETVALSAGPSKIAGTKDNAAPDAAPALALSSGAGSGTLSALAAPVSASTPSTITQSELEPVQVLKRIAPSYPIVAKQRMLSGTVIIEGTVGKDGKINGLRLVSGPPIFRDAAFDAIKQWTFKPAKLNGSPIEQPTKIRLDFVPH